MDVYIQAETPSDLSARTFAKRFSMERVTKSVPETPTTLVVPQATSSESMISGVRVTVPVPAFRHFEQIKGDWDSIEASLKRLKEKSFAGWVEVIYEGQEVIGNLRERVYKLVENSTIEVLKIQNAMLFNAVMKQYEKEVELQDLNPLDVFEQCLIDHGIPDDQKAVLKGLFSEVCRQISEADNQKE